MSIRAKTRIRFSDTGFKIIEMNTIKYFTLLLLISSCENYNHNKITTPSKALNKFVSKVNIQKINLDSLKTTTISITEKNIIYTINNEYDTNNLLIGSIGSVIKDDNNFYIFDFNSKNIFKLNSKGRIDGPITGKGRGPGQHQSAGKLMINSKLIYSSDYNNARINRYSFNMEVQKSIPLFQSNQIDLNDDFILVSNSKSSGFSALNSENELIVISSINNLTDTVATILPRIVPPGFQPQVFNRPMFSINDAGMIVASYKPLPWLFIYGRNFICKEVIMFEGTFLDSLDMPSLDFFKPKGNKGYGGQMPINNFKLMNNDDIYITIRNEIIHLKIDSLGKYISGKKIILNPKLDTKSDLWTWVFSEVISTSGDTLFIKNPEYVLKVVI